MPTVELSRAFSLVIDANPGICGEHPAVDAVCLYELEQHARQRRNGKATIEDVEIGIAEGLDRTDSMGKERRAIGRRSEAKLERAEFAVAELMQCQQPIHASVDVSVDVRGDLLRQKQRFRAQHRPVVPHDHFVAGERLG